MARNLLQYLTASEVGWEQKMKMIKSNFEYEKAGVAIQITPETQKLVASTGLQRDILENGGAAGVFKVEYKHEGYLDGWGRLRFRKVKVIKDGV